MPEKNSSLWQKITPYSISFRAELFFSEHILLDFAHRVSWQGFDKFNILWLFVACKSLFAISYDFFFCQLNIIFQNHECLHRFPEKFIWHANNGTFQDSVMRINSFFHLRRVNIKTSGYYKVFASAKKCNIPILIHFSYVSGYKPTIMEAFFCFFRGIPIALEDIGAFKQNFAFFSLRHFIKILICYFYLYARQW